MEKSAADACILIADDSPIERQVAEELLSRAYSTPIVTASDGEEALRCMEGRTVSLVLTDLRMPGLDGLGLLRAVRERRPEVPVVIMTSKGSEEAAVEALQNGAAGYVVKRNLQRQLVEIVGRVLSAAKQNCDLACALDALTTARQTLLLGNDRARLPGAIAYLQNLARNFGVCDEAGSVQLGVALEEALLNAVIHGNLEVSSDLRFLDDDSFERTIRERAATPPYANRRVAILCNINRSSATFEITDEGPGFDVASLPDPTDPENIIRPFGRGLLLMRSFMNQLDYNSAGNSVRMTLLAKPLVARTACETDAKRELVSA